MPVIIMCPRCGEQVELRQHGFVKKHGSPTACIFVRTAHTGGIDSETRRAQGAERAAAAKEIHARRLVAKEALRIKLILEAEDAAKAKEQRRRDKLAAELANPRVQCPKCNAKIHRVGGSALLQAHLRSDSNRWCSGGASPTDEQRKKAAKEKRKQNVWAVSGGLPTLGRRG